MNKLNRFFAKNPWFSYLVTGLLLTIFWLGYFFAEYSLTATIIFSIAVVIIYPLLPLGAANKLSIEAAKKLRDECDPYPLLLETQDQLTYVKNIGRRQLIMMDYASALNGIGKSDEAYENLCSINLDLNLGATIETRAVYYFGMSNLSLEVGKYEESLSYHTKASQIAGAIKNKKLKESIFSSLRTVAAEQAIYRKDYDTAISLLSTVEDKNKITSVSKAFLYGKIAIAQGNTEAAKNNLLFVINNGNKLGCVEQARQILATL